MKKTAQISVHKVGITLLAMVVSLSASATEPFKTNESLTKTKKLSFPALANKVSDDSELREGEFGIRYMPTFFALDIRSSEGQVIEGAVAYSHGFGVMFGSYHNTHTGYMIEVNYYNITQKYRDRNLEREVTISYVNIPLLLSLNTDKSAPFNLNFHAGPQLGLNVGSSLRTSSSGETDTLNAVVAVKRGDIGFAYGIGAEFMLNEEHTCRFDFGYRGFYGFVDMDAEVVGDNTYNVIVAASRKTNAAYIGLTLLF